MKYLNDMRKGITNIKSNVKVKVSAVLVGLGLVGSSFAVPLLVSASDTTVVVRPPDMATNISEVISNPSAWFFYNDENDTIDNSLGSFVFGPGSAPAGDGSIQIGVTGTQRRNLATYQFGGTKLEDITELKFSTFNPSAGNGGSSNRSGYLHFNIDFDGTDVWQRRLIFLPSDNGSISQNNWDEWDAVNGGTALYRYSGSLWPGTATPGTTPRMLSDLISSYPGVRIRVSDPWLGIRVGEPYADGYTENIDKVVFGTTSSTKTFDFEPVNQPTKNKDCTDGKWEAYNAPNFSSEKACKNWVHDRVSGRLWMSGPSQEIEFRAFNNVELFPGSNPKRDTVRYANYDYPGGLEYTTDVLCTNASRLTADARFMFQIPAGHPGLSGLYVVAYVTEGKNGTSSYGHAATADEATAKQWCKTGQGFSPSMYDVTRGWVNVR